MKAIELDGSTGEGGGQLVRNAIALSAVTSQPVKIVNVRGNRPGPRGGLKSQHFTAIAWLAKVTKADVKGLEVGSKTLEFTPKDGPGSLLERNISIRSDSPAASALLIFQAVFPFLLFAGNDSGEPIELTISGGTNVSFSLSYEYLDQVLLPALDCFGVRVERKLKTRGWSTGSASRGSLWFKIQPLPLGATLILKADPEAGSLLAKHVIKAVDITIIAPSSLHQTLEEFLRRDLAHCFPEAGLNLVLAEESHQESRIYALAVAKSETLRWGRDIYRGKRKGKTIDALSSEVSGSVSRDLSQDIRSGSPMDEFLQDQLIIFQALAAGRTSFPRGSVQAEASEGVDTSTEEIETKLNELQIEKKLQRDKVKGPCGTPELDSTHTMTARWVASMILPGLKWYNDGSVCEGIGLTSGFGGVS